jgi:hypothetical protein
MPTTPSAFPAIDVPTLQHESLSSPVDATLISAIVGGSLGGIFLVTVIICVAVRRRRQRQDQGQGNVNTLATDLKSMPIQPAPTPVSTSTIYQQFSPENEYSAVDLKNRNSRYDDASVLRADQD